MTLLLNFIILIVAFVALIKGADFFVDGAAALAKYFKVPGAIIGLTVVALGTSLPELAVSTSAAIGGSNEIALSNVLGSNTFNLLVVLGVCACVHELPVEKNILKRDFPFSIIISVLIVGVWFLISGDTILSTSITAVDEVVSVINRPVAIVMLIVFVGYISCLVVHARRHPEECEEEYKSMSLGKAFVLIIVGVTLIIVGGQGVVYAAKAIARAFGMSETLIGLTIVAVGTSLPELVTSIVASRKGEVGLAIGNAVGSNIFNLLLILGVSAAINPITVNMASVIDLCIVIGITVMTMIFSASKNKLVRWEGVIMVMIYAADVIYAGFR